MFDTINTGWDLYEKSGINADRMVEFLEANITNKFKNKLKIYFLILYLVVSTMTSMKISLN